MKDDLKFLQGNYKGSSKGMEKKSLEQPLVWLEKQGLLKLVDYGLIRPISMLP